MNLPLKLIAQDQGKIVVEVGEEWYVMFPDGTTKVFASKKAVEVAAKNYFKRSVEPGHVGVGRIEWRT